MKLKDQLYALYATTKRNMKMFLLDKAAVFFSLLAPLIVLMLFVLFLGDLQVDSIVGAFKDAGLAYNEKAVHGFVNCWMFAGVMAVACITVSFGANAVMVGDRQKGLMNDYNASPVAKWVITASYYVFNFVVTAFICLLVLMVCFICLGIAGQFTLSVGEGFALIGLTLVSSLSATLITVFIAQFFKSYNAFSSFTGILSAAIGFIIGAYMPLSMYPKAMQYIVLFVPGSYSAALFRTFFMQGALDVLTGGLPEIAGDAMRKELTTAYTMELDFFGTPASQGLLWGILVGAIALFAILSVVVVKLKKSA